MNETYCRTCGQESHCNNVATVRVNGQELGIHEVVICDSCKCDKCEIKDKK